MKKSGMNGLIASVRQLEEVKRQARALGMFVDGRDLLECPSCGLWEDVTCEGVLLTYHKDSSLQEDTGLRFKVIDETRFECPACGATVRAVDEDGGRIIKTGCTSVRPYGET